MRIARVIPTTFPCSLFLLLTLAAGVSLGQVGIELNLEGVHSPKPAPDSIGLNLQETQVVPSRRNILYLLPQEKLPALTGQNSSPADISVTQKLVGHETRQFQILRQSGGALPSPVILEMGQRIEGREAQSVTPLEPQEKQSPLYVDRTIESKEPAKLTLPTIRQSHKEAAFANGDFVVVGRETAQLGSMDVVSTQPSTPSALSIESTFQVQAESSAGALVLHIEGLIPAATVQKDFGRMTSENEVSPDLLQVQSVRKTAPTQEIVTLMDARNVVSVEVHNLVIEKLIAGPNQ